MSMRSAAGRMQVIQDLLDTNIYAEDGVTVIGQKEPVITKEQALELLNMEPREEENCE